MKWLGFIVFIIITFIYIWNGRDVFSKKEWMSFSMRFLAVLIGAFILVIILVGASKYLHLIDRESARALSVIIPASIMTMLISKLFVIALFALFKIIMRFHHRYNTFENYSKLSSIGDSYGTMLSLIVKAVASFGCVIMFYGIWFGSTV
ncbi:hypothetical protein [Candidatus Pantoea soli]|uniref:Uncharacterized protein n=1 Tax=Candidatus Pantoea soli TaxID=3098669 RepID=A0A518X9N5_9GAMM|nr:hypothetical protein [Pantoea soli]QDY40884.1 hypothetical protein D8B20_02725 [Pantoea soli]